MTTVNVSVIINRSTNEVFAYLSNFENNPQWQAGMKEAIITSKGPLRVGPTYNQVASFMGRRIESSFEVIEFKSNRMIKAKSTSGPFPIQFMRAVEPVEDGTLVTAVIEGEADGFFKLAGPWLKAMTKRQIKDDYANLKQILECAVCYGYVSVTGHAETIQLGLKSA